MCGFLGADDPHQVEGLHLRHVFPLLRDVETTLASLMKETRTLTAQDFSGRKHTVGVRAHKRERRWLLVLEAAKHELPNATNRDDSRLAGLGMLVAGVAHEINNPLTFVLPALKDAIRIADTLGGNVAHRIELQTLLTEALEGVQRVAKIASDLREFKRSDDTLVATDVNSIVIDTINLADVRLRGKVKLRHVLGMPIEVMGNPTRLSQVILNLVLNAAQAIPSAQQHAAEISVRSWHDSEHVHISVEDNGEGIEPGKVEKIFDPFFSTKNAGTGLGLSVCAGIVKRMGGWIEVDSTVGVGSVFTVVIPSVREKELNIGLPQKKEQPAPLSLRPVDPESIVPPSTEPLKLLVVDDEPLVIRSVKRMVGRHANVVQASGGWEAINLLREGLQVECVVSDMVMPEGGGLELWAWVRENRPELRERFCFMTGMAPSEGADPDLPPAIHKPFSVDELVSTLRLVSPVSGTDYVPLSASNEVGRSSGESSAQR